MVLKKRGVSSVQNQLWPLVTIKICMKYLRTQTSEYDEEFEGFDDDENMEVFENRDDFFDPEN